jgi:hypothetical protein
MVGMDFLTNLFIGGGIVLLVFLTMWNAVLPTLVATPIVLAVVFMIPLGIILRILAFGLKEDQKQEMI